MDVRTLEEMVASGVLTEDWKVAMVAVPRRDYLPDRVWEYRNNDAMWHPVDRSVTPQCWARLANHDTQVVTQVDDGCPVGPDDLGDMPTSSMSKPSVVATMLKHLEISGGERVLEIGTGTGWNAALLAQRLGPDRITSIEIDHEIAENARQALQETGFGKVRVVTGNGSNGYEPEAPYHRVISTAACHTVPYAWVQQCRPRGRIVTPWGSQFKNWALLALDVNEDGTAVGGVVGTADFMRLRDQRLLDPWVTPDREEEARATTGESPIHPVEVMRRGDVLMAMAAWVPNCRARYSQPLPETGNLSAMYLSDARTGSWARLLAEPGGEGPHRVVQGGERRLMDEVKAAYERWVREGSPGTDEWLITVGKDGQRMELV